MTRFRHPISSTVSRVSQRVITHCRQLVCGELPEYRVQQIGLAVNETVTDERAQLIARVNMARHTNCYTHTLSMGVRN